MSQSKKEITELKRKKAEAVKKQNEADQNRKELASAAQQLITLMTILLDKWIALYKNTSNHVNVFTTSLREEVESFAGFTRSFAIHEQNRTITFGEYLQRRKSGAFMKWIAKVFVKTDYLERFRKEVTDTTNEGAKVSHSVNFLRNIAFVTPQKAYVTLCIARDIVDSSTYSKQHLMHKYNMTEGELMEAIKGAQQILTPPVTAYGHRQNPVQNEAEAVQKD